jgi:UPF0755 protein
MSPRKNITYSSHPNHAARSAHAKGDKMFRTYDTSAIRPKRSPIPAIIAIIILAAAALAVVGGLIAFTRGCTTTPMAKKGAEVTIVVEDGEGAKSIAKTLADAGLIASQSEFTDRVAQMGADGTLHPGTYTLIGGQSVDEIITVLQAPVEAVTFTVPEGCTLAQTAEIVATASEGRISAKDFIAAASDASKYAGSYSFLGSAGKNSLEGFLFPKTYPIAEDSTADSIIRAMLDQFGSETAGLDLSYATSRGLSFYDVVKLASIVEEESDAEHRAEVASVFYNRLMDGWMLQSDATVAYVVGHDPTPEDVNTYDDYNTYFILGLPPTPIDSPSLESLQAVCNPAQTDYYYFYFEPGANGKMTYSFSSTYEEHQQTYE